MAANIAIIYAITAVFAAFFLHSAAKISGLCRLPLSPVAEQGLEAVADAHVILDVADKCLLSIDNVQLHDF